MYPGVNIVKVAVIGGTGYGSIELIRLINIHPYLEIGTIVSNSQAGNQISSTYPHLSGINEQSLEKFDADRLAKENNIIFLATPSGVSSSLAPQLIDKGSKCIDLSGDFRIRSGDIYEQWYKHSPAPQDYLAQAVYGLCEMNAQNIKTANLIANPGCYPTATLLGLMPIIKTGLADLESIIIDAKSGVSGAGRGLSLTSHFAELNENLKTYKMGAHQHIPEIEQSLTDESGVPVTITFTPHLIPMTRGIMCTIYVKLKDASLTEEVQEIYNEFYENKPFVRIRPAGSIPATKEVLGSNYCDIGLHVDPRTKRLTIISVIDNLVKGAAGQAIQNVNIMNGWDETTGLNDTPLYP